MFHTIIPTSNFNLFVCIFECSLEQSGPVHFALDVQNSTKNKIAGIVKDIKYHFEASQVISPPPPPSLLVDACTYIPFQNFLTHLSILKTIKTPRKIQSLTYST